MLLLVQRDRFQCLSKEVERFPIKVLVERRQECRLIRWPFLQQIGTMVQSAMQPFAQQLTVEVSQLGARVDMIQTELQAEIARRTAVQQRKSPSSEGLSNISVTGFGERRNKPLALVERQYHRQGMASIRSEDQRIRPCRLSRGTSRRQDHRLHRVRSHPMKDPQMEGISSLVLTSGCLRCRFQTSRSGRLRDRRDPAVLGLHCSVAFVGCIGFGCLCE